MDIYGTFKPKTERGCDKSMLDTLDAILIAAIFEFY